MSQLKFASFRLSFIFVRSIPACYKCGKSRESLCVVLNNDAVSYCYAHSSCHVLGLSSRQSSMLEKGTSSGPFALQTSWLEKGMTNGLEQASSLIKH